MAGGGGGRGGVKGGVSADRSVRGRASLVPTPRQRVALWGRLPRGPPRSHQALEGGGRGGGSGNSAAAQSVPSPCHKTTGRRLASPAPPAAPTPLAPSLPAWTCDSPARAAAAKAASWIPVPAGAEEAAPPRRPRGPRRICMTARPPAPSGPRPPPHPCGPPRPRPGPPAPPSLPPPLHFLSASADGQAEVCAVGEGDREGTGGLTTNAPLHYIEADTYGRAREQPASPRKCTPPVLAPL